jgi:hypothetical protein
VRLSGTISLRNDHIGFTVYRKWVRNARLLSQRIVWCTPARLFLAMSLNATCCNAVTSHATSHSSSSPKKAALGYTRQFVETVNARYDPLSMFHGPSRCLTGYHVGLRRPCDRMPEPDSARSFKLIAKKSRAGVHQTIR